MNTKKGSSTKKAAVKKSEFPTTSTFEIELKPPKPIRGLSENSRKAIHMLELTLPKVPKNAAFIIPADVKHSIQKFLKDNYPKEKFSFNKIVDNPEKIRVYRMDRVR